MKNSQKTICLFLLLIGVTLLVLQRFFTAVIPIWLDGVLLVLSGLFLVIPLIIAKLVGTTPEIPQESGADSNFINR